MSNIDLEEGIHRRSGSDVNSGEGSNVSDYSTAVEIERNLVPKINYLHLAKVEKDICRICHLSFNSNTQESGFPIKLGCSCKEDLASAHKHCAEAWFKIKGNKTCEICHSIAYNVVGVKEIESSKHQQSNETSNYSTSMATTAVSDTQSFCNCHHLLNFLFGCIVFAFIMSFSLYFSGAKGHEK